MKWRFGLDEESDVFSRMGNMIKQNHDRLVNDAKDMNLFLLTVPYEERTKILDKTYDGF